MDVADAKRLKALEKENAELKRIYAEAMLGNKILKEALEKSSERGAAARAGRSGCGPPGLTTIITDIEGGPLALHPMS